MPSASQLRTNIERQLAGRIPAALTPVPRQLSRTVPAGVPTIDALTGGLPVGAITEVTGPAGSGRTALSLAAVALATRTGHVSAWVDTSNTFDPLSASASGVLLDRMLWVRCLPPREITQATPPVQQQSGFRTPHTDRVQHGGSPHPRSEERGLPEAVHALLANTQAYRKDRITGTPGAPNRPLTQSSTPRHRLSLRIEQAGTDRQPSRRGRYVLQQRERTVTAQLPLAVPAPGRGTSHGRPWQRIDQALRITDLLLQAGGFQVIVLDMADIAAEHVSRIPLATWFRFRAAAQHAQSALLLLTQHPCTGSSSAMLLRTETREEVAETTYFPGLRLSAVVARQRFEHAAAPSSVIPIHKPPRSVPAADWSAPAPWAGRV